MSCCCVSYFVPNESPLLLESSDWHLCRMRLFWTFVCLWSRSPGWDHVGTLFDGGALLSPSLAQPDGWLVCMHIWMLREYMFDQRSHYFHVFSFANSLKFGTIPTLIPYKTLFPCFVQLSGYGSRWPSSTPTVILWRKSLPAIRTCIICRITLNTCRQSALSSTAWRLFWR